MAVISIFRRAACMKWLPPMARASPSPMGTKRVSSGLESFTPVAKARARPCRVCREWKSTYPEILAEQPIHEIMTISFMLSSCSYTAHNSELRIVPWTQPGHHIWGKKRCRR